MDKYESLVNGKPITYTKDGIQFGNLKLSFSDMSDITLKDNAWTCVYQGRTLQIPFDASEKESIETFIPKVNNGTDDDLIDLLLTPQETPSSVDPVKPIESDKTKEALTEAVPVSQSAQESEQSYKPNKRVGKTDKKNKTKQCKHCGAEIAKSAKVCPRCGGKNKKPIFKRVWFWLLLIVILILILAIAGSGNQYKLSDDASSMSEADYKAACQEIDYKELARNAEKYEGTKIKFTGQVNQVVSESEEGNTESQYKVAVTKDEYDFYEDDVLLYYQRGDNKKLLEDDIITMYGEASGTESYTSVLGESITVPVITAVYIDIED